MAHNTLGFVLLANETKPALLLGSCELWALDYWTHLWAELHVRQEKRQAASRGGL